MKKIIGIIAIMMILGASGNRALAAEAVAYYNENGNIIAEQNGLVRVIDGDKCSNAIGLTLTYKGTWIDDRTWWNAEMKYAPSVDVDCDSYPTEQDGLVFVTGLIPEIKGAVEFEGHEYNVVFKAAPVNVSPLPPGRWVLEQVEQIR